MKSLFPAARVFFIAVALLALWVGFWGFFFPAEVDRAIPWLIPPLHARFVGALYLAGFAMMLGGLGLRRRAELRILLLMTACWTGSLLIISLFYLSEFDPSRIQVWFWFGAYIAYPAAGLWLAWRAGGGTDAPEGARLPRGVRVFLSAQGVLVLGLALLLLSAPDFMIGIWPWKITRLLAQLYAGLFLALGLGSLLASRLETLPEVRVVTLGILIAALGVSIASLLHRELFAPDRLATWVWFAGFALAGASNGLIWLRARRAGGAG
jgi:hypothetical protein